MEFKWKEMKLGEVINLKRGYDLPASKRLHGSVPIMASSGFNGYHNEWKVSGPGVITGRSGQLGKVFYTEDNYWPLNTTLYVEDFKGNYPKYIYYLLKTLNFEQLNAGSSVPTLNRNHAHQLKVKLPEYDLQKKIADTLFVFEEKIILNNSIIKNLEKISQTLFNNWFIDFEFPNENGQPYKSGGGKMIESELGEIPISFKVGTFKEVLELKYGKALTKKNRIPGEYPVYGSGGVIGTHVDYLINGPGLIIGRKGSIGTVYLEFKDFYPIDTVFYVESKIYESTFLYLLFKRYDFTNSNNDSAVPGLNREFVYNTKITIPPREIIKEFQKINTPISEQIENILLENERLQSLHNSLLPKMLSGEFEMLEKLEV